jgi:hypothetical protein
MLASLVKAHLNVTGHVTSTPIFDDSRPTGSVAAAANNTASDPVQTDLWIFRDGRRNVSGLAMVRDLSHRISQANSRSWVDALIQAGELEAALWDDGSPGAGAASELTDALAYGVCTGKVNQDPAQLVSRIVTPHSISVSPPEGFTYYALHPLDFAKLATRVPAEPIPCAVIGIRSIGTTLSAMTAASLKATGRSVTRITVRPTGHPYSRITEFTPEQSRWINDCVSASAQFLIVDEGPGRSGSTFLSVAEALAQVGVRRETITILGSRQFDPESLCARDAAARWQDFRYVSTTPSVNTRFEKCLYIGGGDWRKYLCGEQEDEENWPESWTQMERLKFLSADRQTFFKFEGMGPSGAEVCERAFTLAHAGFSPHVSNAGDGFLAYTMLNGRHLQQGDLNASLLERIARYCAFRVLNFGCESSQPDELRKMLEFNIHQEFGLDLNLDDDELLCLHPVLADGRMQPYEWIASDSNEVLKTDAISHGDNHFFPGPCDIAWDLAGTAIEWQLSPNALDFLLRKFRQLSGVNPFPGLRRYMLAYSVFRLGFCKMAMSTVSGSAEERRLQSAFLYYRSQAERLLERPTFLQPGQSIAAWQPPVALTSLQD